MTQIDMLDALLRARHSCRGFLPDQVPSETVERIIEVAGRVPSWCNSQPWHVIVTRGDETDRFRAAIMQAALNDAPRPDMPWPEAYEGVYRDRRRTCGFQLYDAVGIPKEDRDGTRQQMLENYNLFGAPHVAIITSESKLGPYGAMDSGGFVAAFTLAAEALGIASIPQAAVAAYGPTVRDFFAIPEGRTILCAISLGYKDAAHPANAFRTDRAPLGEILDWRGAALE